MSDATDATVKPLPVGWQCPKCGTVNAPYIARCQCSPEFQKIVYVPYPIYPQPYYPPWNPDCPTYKVTCQTGGTNE